MNTKMGDFPRCVSTFCEQLKHLTHWKTHCTPYIWRAWHRCVSSCESLETFLDWTLCHKCGRRRAYHPCVFLCDSAAGTCAWNIFHKNCTPYFVGPVANEPFCGEVILYHLRTLNGKKGIHGFWPLLGIYSGPLLCSSFWIQSETFPSSVSVLSQQNILTVF